MPDDVPFQCPQCGGEPHKTWGPTSLVMVHWLLNPGLAFNELILGQRVPRHTYMCTSCALDLQHRSYLRCPSCGQLHSGMLWGKTNAFFHYMGLFCPDCGEKIPAMRNGLFGLRGAVRRLHRAGEAGRPDRVDREHLREPTVGDPAVRREDDDHRR